MIRFCINWIPLGVHKNPSFIQFIFISFSFQGTSNRTRTQDSTQHERTKYKENIINYKRRAREGGKDE